VTPAPTRRWSLRLPQDDTAEPKPSTSQLELTPNRPNKTLHEQNQREPKPKEVSGMPDILHRVGIKSSSPEGVYKALTTVEGLSAWWTNDTQGEDNVGGVLKFRFHDDGIDMKVLELRPTECVQWQVADGPQDWIGTKILWDLSQEDDYTIVLFRHQGWKEPVEFMHHCSTKWGTFLMSLKSLVETGKGSPSPHDVKISNWDYQDQ